MIWRYRPPNGCGTDAPGTFATWLRTAYCARSRNCVSLRPSPFNVIRQTGSEDASNFSTTGGSVPGGKRRRLAIARFEMLVTAESELVPGWKYTLIKLTPGKDRDSMCSILLASVKNRSKRPVMSASICSGGMPEKNVATITTGMLISGKRSTGIRATAVIPTTAIIRHTTRIRYGLRIEKPGISDAHPVTWIPEVSVLQECPAPDSRARRPLPCRSREARRALPHGWVFRVPDSPRAARDVYR